jgi:hypothetical protein
MLAIGIMTMIEKDVDSGKVKPVSAADAELET